MPRQYDLEERLITFAALICRIAEDLPPTLVGIHIARQRARSGTSPASNYGEAQAAESVRDFVHKLKRCVKELRETHVWLELLPRLGLGDASQISGSNAESDELIAILVKSIKTARTRQPA